MGRLVPFGDELGDLGGQVGQVRKVRVAQELPTAIRASAGAARWG
jgi:hypothetical protein